MEEWGEATQGGFRGVGNTLFLDVNAGYTDLFTLWEFIKLYTYDLCTFVYTYTSINLQKQKKHNEREYILQKNTSVLVLETDMTKKLVKQHE